MEVKIRLLRKGARIPAKATGGAIAYDVTVPSDFVIRPGRQLIPLGLALEMPYGYEAKIEPRSGYSLKGVEARYNDYTIRIDADVIVGKIDSDYRGEIGVIIKSNEKSDFVIPGGTRIAQLTFYKGEDADFKQTDTLSETERGEGGYGHTNDNPHITTK